MKHNFDEVVNRKGSYCTQWDFIQDRFNERDLLPFSISDTDFRIPMEITKKLEEVIQHQIYGYTRWNHHDFKSAIASYFHRRFVCVMQEDWILYSPSVMYSVSLLIRLLSKAKDRVITFNPMYDAFFHVIEDNDRELVNIHLIKENSTYTIDFEELEKQLPHSRILLLCSPHNPTGRIWSDEELQSIVRLCKRYDVRIISDEIHMDIQLREDRHIPILRYVSTYEHVYLVSSCSKTLNVPGLIGSYAIVPNIEIYESFLHQTRHKDFLNSASIFGMYATMVGYTECDAYIDDMNKYIIENMRYVESFLKEMKDISFVMPQATYLAWMDLSKLPFTSEQIQDALVHIGKVGIMKGETYGEGGKKHLRLNCGCPKSKLVDGLQRFKKAIDWLYEQESRDTYE